MKRPVLFALAGLAVGLAVGVRRARGTKTKGLRALDADFHATYDQLRTTEACSAPVLVLFGDVLILFDAGLRAEFIATAPATQLLKRAAHVPVGVFVTLQTSSGEAEMPLDAAVAERLVEIQSAIGRALVELETLHAAARCDAQTVLETSRNFIQQTLARGCASAMELTRFGTDLGPLLLRLTEQATRLELEALHAAVEAALSQLTAHQRSELEVVVAGVHQARARSLPLQYFQKRFQEAPGEEKRVTYAESVDDALQARALVGTRRLDRSIALAFFGNAKKLQRDVLGDAATRLLEHAEFGRLP